MEKPKHRLPGSGVPTAACWTSPGATWSGRRQGPCQSWCRRGWGWRGRVTGGDRNCRVPWSSNPKPRGSSWWGEGEATSPAAQPPLPPLPPPPWSSSGPSIGGGQRSLRWGSEVTKVGFCVSRVAAGGAFLGGRGRLAGPRGSGLGTDPQGLGCGDQLRALAPGEPQAPGRRLEFCSVDWGAAAGGRGEAGHPADPLSDSDQTPLLSGTPPGGQASGDPGRAARGGA